MLLNSLFCGFSNHIFTHLIILQSEKKSWIKKAYFTYSSKKDILIQDRFNKLIYGINTIVKYGIWHPVNFLSVFCFELDQ